VLRKKRNSMEKVKMQGTACRQRRRGRPRTRSQDNITMIVGWDPLKTVKEQGHCSACRRKWRLTDTDLGPCGEIQTMSHTVESCPLTKLNGGLSRLHSADEDAVSWLTSYGSWNAYEKKKNEDYPWSDWELLKVQDTSYI